LVLGVLEELAELGWRINFSSMLEGLSKVEWPGRLHVFQKEPMIVLDGAHNAAASQWLASALRRLSGPTRWSIVFGAMRDKPAAEMMQALSEFAARFYLVPVMGMPDRTFSASELRGQLEGAGYSGEIEECACVDEALSRARARAEGILVAGSLYLVGEALERLGWGVPPDPC
jgi:dihydrofolate synthase/folylpolyglutamate synthase